MRKPFRDFMPVTLVFILFTAFFIIGRNLLVKWDIDQNVVLIGNVLLFLITLLSFWLGLKGLKNPNTHAFVRSVNSSMVVKLFLCAIAAFTYISMYKDHLSKPALFTCMGLYLFYTFLEVSILMRLLKDRK